MGVVGIDHDDVVILVIGWLPCRGFQEEITIESSSFDGRLLYERLGVPPFSEKMCEVDHMSVEILEAAANPADTQELAARDAVFAFLRVC